MNRLPEHRRVIHARTWPTTWRPEDDDPIERPHVSTGDLIAGWLIAIGIGVALAVAVVEALAS
jgi:hypothetical protein